MFQSEKGQELTLFPWQHDDMHVCVSFLKYKTIQYLCICSVKTRVRSRVGRLPYDSDRGVRRKLLKRPKRYQNRYVGVARIHFYP